LESYLQVSSLLSHEYFPANVFAVTTYLSMNSETIATQLALKCNIHVFGKGTGNGMIKSLLDSAGEPCTPAHAVLAAIRGILLLDKY